MRRGGADRFLEFIDGELKPWVNENFRTEPFEILGGHSFGGLFAVHVMLNRPDSFDAYIAVSPSLWWDDRVVFDYEIAAPLDRVVTAFADLERYPEWTGGRADRGVIHEEREHTDGAGNRIIEVEYSVWALGVKSSGTRVYTFAADRPHVAVDLRFFTWVALEDADTRWEFEEVEGRTQVRQRGTRTVPWLLSRYADFHSEQVLGLFQNIEVALAALPDAATPGRH